MLIYTSETFNKCPDNPAMLPLSDVLIKYFFKEVEKVYWFTGPVPIGLFYLGFRENR
jgi:hypothetical protein